MTSQALFASLEKNINTVPTTLNTVEKQQFLQFLAEVAEAENDEETEDAVDGLFEFCLNVPPLKGTLSGEAEGHLAFQKGKPNFKPMTEKEQDVRLIANRLIKAMNGSMSHEETQPVLSLSKRRNTKKEKEKL